MNIRRKKILLYNKQLIVGSFFYFKNAITEIWPNIRLNVFMTPNRRVNEVSNGHTCRQGRGRAKPPRCGWAGMATEQTNPCYSNETQTLNPEQLSHAKGFNSSISSLLKNHFRWKGNLQIYKNTYMQNVNIVIAKKYHTTHSGQKVMLCLLT